MEGKNLNKEEKIVNKGILKFRPKARLLSLLGHQLITDEVIALIELVKNSYDADATSVTVKLTNAMMKNRGLIEIIDDGHGMTLEIIEKAWMEPAKDNKIDEKGNRPRTTRFGRSSLGEKGVGRFSVDKLGLKLEMISRYCEFDSKTKEVSKISEDEVILIIEGKQFTGEYYLDEIECKWERRKPIIFTDKNHGTLLRISQLRSEWTEEMIRRVHLGLARLSSPFKEAKDFDIHFISNDLSNLPEKIENPLLDLAPWVLDGEIDENGILKYSIQGPDKIRYNKEKDLKIGEDRFQIQGGKYRKPICGPFKFKLYGFEKRKSELIKYGIDKDKQDLLREVSGISIYRNGFRVLPYGEKGNDWLLIDKKRILKPISLGNDRVIGYIEITREKNPYLIDKTNREGLIEQGQAFPDFKELSFRVYAVLDIFRQTTIDKIKKRDIWSVQEAEDDIDAGRKKILDSVEKTNETLNTILYEIDSGDQKSANRNVEYAKNLVNESKKATEIIRLASNKLLEEIKISQEQIDNLISLSGIGMTAERMTHELSKAAHNAKNILKNTEQIINAGNADIKIINKNLSLIYGQLQIIVDHIRLMEPLYYSKKEAAEELNVADIARNMGHLFSNTIKDLNIDFEVIEESKLIIDINKGHLMQIFNNLFDNTFYWLKYKPPNERPKIIIKVSGKEKSIIFADNGPDVDEDIRHRIFDPFISLKKDGRGLGLYIVEDILNQYKGKIELKEERKILNGANFQISFGGD